MVQNPRSNRHNRVGYPRALGESTRVALGTDGFVSDMTDEVAALRDEAAAHGDPPGVVTRRLDAGQQLANELLGPVAATDAGRDAGELESKIARIRAEASEAASALWKRMASL